MTFLGKHHFRPSATDPEAHGAVAAAHPLAVEAGIEVLRAGGTAVDAAIGAQAVVCVLLPHAAGLGGDLMALVEDGGKVHAVTGAGRSAASLDGPPGTSGGASVTVPGLVDGWLTMQRRWGRLPLVDVLAPAVALARHGAHIDSGLEAALSAQRRRLHAGGAASWSLLEATRAGTTWTQPALADLLDGIARRKRNAFYAGSSATAIIAAVARTGGAMDEQDLDAHKTLVGDPIVVDWAGGRVFVQPPPSQGVLLALALRTLVDLLSDGATLDDHLLIEVTEAAFARRDFWGRGSVLLDEPLTVNLEHSSGRGGPRAYLHTAGVATADADGQVVSSLVSVFDDFGSGVFVPELGIVLNNRAAGFTEGDNRPGPARRPVHTLAPSIVRTPTGDVCALATPGADGQVQTLLQVLTAVDGAGVSLADAVAAPRWRSQEGHLMLEQGHPAEDDLLRRGHDVRTATPGADMFGAVVAAGRDSRGCFAVADWRRTTDAGVIL